MSESDDSSKVFLKSVDPDTLPSQNPAYESTGPDGSSSSAGSSPSLVMRTIEGQTVSGSMQSGTFVSEDGTLLQLPNGFVEHGTTDSAGDFLAYTTVDGKQVTGNFNSDGSAFLSSDGTIYVDKGVVETGITDPATGNFLPKGTTRVIADQTVYGTIQNGAFFSEDGTILQLPNGFVEHGTTDSSGNFLAYTVIDGQQVKGNFSSDGSSFMSSDGTIYVDKGVVERGITDPTTGNFLPNGTTRVIADQTVYGMLTNNGSFISEDGTILQLPSGFVEHGTTDAAGDFTAELTVDGKQVSGNYDDKGNFMSTDGTVYVPAGGAPELGVTDPTTNNFLPGGTTYVLPGGTTLYGYKEPDGSFWSYDGSTIVLSNGTAVTGSLTKGDGIFAGSNGLDYFVGQNGIQQVTPNQDGSFTIIGGSGGVIMTPASWKTDLAAFQTAMTQVGTDISNISDAYDTIQTQYAMVESYWSSPAGTSFQEATTAVDYAMGQLNLVLDSISSALQASYSNYEAAEQQTINQFNAASS